MALRQTWIDKRGVKKVPEWIYVGGCCRMREKVRDKEVKSAREGEIADKDTATSAEV